MEAITDIYLDAARSFRDLVERIPEDAWARPGLGVWTVHELVGHTSRSLVTVIDYLDRPAEREEVAAPADYYVWVKTATSTDPDAVAERGREAARKLGNDPVAAIDRLIAEVTEKLADAGNPVIETVAGGMRLRPYLSTRVFELAVHSLDVAAATGLEAAIPEPVLAETMTVAAQAAVRLGSAVPALMALTGRARLPDGFSVV